MGRALTEGLSCRFPLTRKDTAPRLAGARSARKTEKPITITITTTITNTSASASFCERTRQPKPPTEADGQQRGRRGGAVQTAYLMKRGRRFDVGPISKSDTGGHLARRSSCSCLRTKRRAGCPAGGQDAVQNDPSADGTSALQDGASALHDGTGLMSRLQDGTSALQDGAHSRDRACLTSEAMLRRPSDLTTSR